MGRHQEDDNIYIYIYISVVQRRGRGTSLEVISR